MDNRTQPLGSNGGSSNSSSRDWMPPFTTASPVPLPYPTPTPLSPNRGSIALGYAQPNITATSSSSPALGLESIPARKVAIPRLAGSDATLHGRRRSARACEPCRQRKIKCDGVRPFCGQCAYQNQQCAYEDVKRVRDQKRLGSLAKRVDAYEALLRDLEAEVDLPTAKKIRNVLKVSLSSSVSPETQIPLDLSPEYRL